MPTPSSGYRLPNGDRVPGTTTIIQRFKDSGALMHWAYKQGREHADLENRGKPAPKRLYEVTDKAADIGTTVHNIVEQHVNQIGKPDDERIGDRAILAAAIMQYGEKWGDEHAAVQSGFEAYLSWEKQTKLKIIDQEMQLICPRYRYGGTPDAIIEIGNKLCLGDYKTSNSVYADFLIQLAAYKNLVENGIRMDTHEPMGMKLDGGFHLLKFSKKHGDFAHHYYPNLDEAWEQFKLFRRAYDIDKQLRERTK